MSLNPVTTAVLLALGASSLSGAALAQSPSPLNQTTVLASQVLLSGTNRSITDISSDNAAPTRVQDSVAQLPLFDPQTGVLLGVQADLSVAAGQTLSTSRSNGGGQWLGTGTVRGSWELGVTPPASVTTGLNSWLAQVVVDRNAPSQQTSTFSGLSYSATGAQANGFVAVSPLQSQFTSTVTTSLSALQDPNAGGNGGNGSNTVTATVNALSGASLTGSLSLRYDYLRHAEVSFDAGGALAGRSLQIDAAAEGFAVHALGDGQTTLLDFVGVSCAGDCGLFQLSFAGGVNLQPGTTLLGSVALATPSSLGQATYTLSFADDNAVGAASSRLAHTLTLEVASAVPEPGSAALLMLGLGALLRRVRRPH